MRAGVVPTRSTLRATRCRKAMPPDGGSMQRLPDLHRIRGFSIKHVWEEAEKMMYAFAVRSQGLSAARCRAAEEASEAKQMVLADEACTC